MKNKTFQATEFIKQKESTIDVININGKMAICSDNNVVIITKQQAMAFWGLCESEPSIINDINDDIDQEKCPAIEHYCKHYTYQKDKNDEITICFCNHKDNDNKLEGNCLASLCPILVDNN